MRRTLDNLNAQAAALIRHLRNARSAFVNKISGGWLRLLFFLMLPAVAVLTASGQPPPPQSIRVVTDDNYPPFVFKDSDGKLQGILIDQWHLWEKKTGVAVEIHAMDWGEAVRRMYAGEFDVIDTIFQTEERSARLDFSKPYAQIEVPIFFQKDISGITDLKSLSGFAVAVKAGDAAEGLLRQAGVSAVLLFNNYESIIEAAKQHKINVFVVDKPPALYFLNKLGIQSDFKYSEPVNVGEFHRAVKRGNVSLLQLIETGFAAITPAELHRIDEKWHGKSITGRLDLRRVAYVGVSALAVILALLAWSWTLSRQVRKRTTALRESEERLRRLGDNLPNGVVYQMVRETDGRSRFLYVSAGIERLNGVSAESVMEDPTLLYKQIVEEDRAKVKAAEEASYLSLTEFNIEIKSRIPSGELRWFHLCSAPRRLPDGRVVWDGIELDITERKQAEELETGQRRVLELIAGGSPLQDTLDTLLQIIEKQLPEMFCSVLLLDSDGVHLRHGAAPRLPVDYTNAIDGVAIGPAVGSCGTAAFRRESVLVADIAHDPLWKDYRQFALPHGLRACWSTPIFDGQKNVLGTFAIYYQKPGLPDARHRQLIDITSQLAAIAISTHRQQAALRASETRLRSIIYAEPECVKIVSSSGMLLEMNPAGLDMLQADSLAEVKKRPLLEFILPEHRTAFGRLHKRVMSGESGTLEFEIIGLKGTRRWLETHAVPLRTADGTVEALLGVSRDITGRKRAETALAGSERRFHFLSDLGDATRNDVDSKEILFTVARMVGSHLRASRCAYASVEDDEDQFTIEHDYTDGCASTMGTYKLSLFGSRAAAQMREGRTLVINDAEAEVIPNEGGDMFKAIGIRALICCPLIKSGALRAMMAVHQITARQWTPEEISLVEEVVERCWAIIERKQAESALRESEERYRLLVEGVRSYAILMLDPLGHVISWNRSAEQIKGYRADEIIGQHFSRFYPKEAVDRGWPEHELQRAAEDGRFEDEGWRVRKDGTQFWANVVITPLRDETGELRGFSKITRDLTEHRQLEEQLRQSQKMDAIGQLAGGVAHDFNNILAVIQMQAALLRSEKSMTAAQIDSAREIESAAQRAANLTRQLLMFSRRQVMQPADLDLNETVANISKMLQRILGEDIQKEFKFSPQQLCVHADPGMMDQVLMNLTVNSRDAMPKGGRLIIETSAVEFDELAASQSPQARPGSFACLTVSDTGCGIPPEIIPRIFEPFFTTKEVGKGTGLGLATIFGIVQQHQGWINVYSEVGLGTTFRVYLPRVEKAAGKKTQDTTLISRLNGHETILVVEDDPSLRLVVRSALSRLGYRVLEASTGVNALELWKQSRNEIDLVLTDMVMPDGMTGRELSQRLLQENPKLKIIYTSGYSTDTAGKNLSLEEGVNFLAKPYRAHKLAETVRAKLDSQ